MTAASGEVGGDGPVTMDTFVGDLFAWLNVIRSDRKLPSLAFVVAYTIGQHMNRGTRTAFPGLLCLAEQVGRDEKSVRKAVHALVNEGHLLIAKRRGGGGSTHYTMPAVKRAKTPALTVDEVPAERAKTPGQNVSGKGAERAKTPGLRDDRTNPERAFSSVQSGRKRPPNQSQEPTSGESATPPRSDGGQANSSTVSADRGHAPAQPQVVPAVVADGVSDHVDLPTPQHVADEADRRRALDRGWRTLVGCEPVLADLNTSPLHDAIAAGAATAEDVTQGIREAMAKPGFRIKAWRQLVGFATTAAKNRMGASPKAVPPSDAPPAADLWELEGGMKRSIPSLEAEVAAWDAGHSWHEATLGFPPDSEFTSLPRHLWRSARGKPRPSGA